MQATYDTVWKSSRRQSDPTPAEIVAEQEAEARRELRELSDVGFAFLSATNGDRLAAEKLFDLALERLFEGGALSLWRYRGILKVIREGL